MPELLFEIGCEELPATFVAPTMAQLETSFREKFTTAKLWSEAGGGAVNVYGTPRRLVIYATGVIARQTDEIVLLKGPSAAVAFDPQGKPTGAALGFARKNGLTAEDLAVMDGYVQATVIRAGRSALDVAGELLPQVARELTFPKAMRWGAGNLRFARPIRWVVALLDDEIIPSNIEHVAAGRATRGHRFLSPEEADVPNPAAYFDIVRQKSVLVQPSERREMIVSQAERLAGEAGGMVQIVEELLDENIFLTEYPTAVLGAFNPEYLTLPRTVLVTAMRKHQRYFPLVSSDGSLMPNFIAVRNGGGEYLDTVRAGFENVLSARFNDARFFDELDSHTPLSTKIDGTKTIVFQEKLGTVYEKSLRLPQITENGGLLEELGQTEILALHRAAELCKADLASEMVKELPTLQGVIGEEYARREGEPEEVARAISGHYKPKGAGDPLPETETGRRLAIADRVDTLVGYAGIGIAPTGTSDPYALRRAAAGLVALLATSDVLPAPQILFEAAWDAYAGQGITQTATREEALASFSLLLIQRMDAALEEKGVRYDVRDSVLATPLRSIYEMQARAIALGGLVDTDEAKDALAASNRVGNILRFAQKEGIAVPSMLPNPALFDDPSEQALLDALAAAEPAFAAELGRCEYAAALHTLAELRPAVDAFFEAVMVMGDDAERRGNRLSLLGRLRALFLQFADFDRIVAGIETRLNPM